MPERRVYTKNFLTDVICKIDYSPVLSLLQEMPVAFQQRVIEELPILEPIVQKGLIINAGQESPKINEANRTVWRFSSSDRGKIVELNSEYLVIGVKKYTNYQDFRAFVASITGSFYELYASNIINRLGLRYVDKIVIDGDNLLDWQDIINPNLVAPLSFFNPEQLLRSINSSVLAIDDETYLEFKWGIFNQAFPEAPVSKEFTLDYDCFTRTAFDKAELLTRLDQFNTIQSQYFESSVEDGLRNLMDAE